jgi:glycosyltransferase involved in cell wall biosynthesis
MISGYYTRASGLNNVVDYLSKFLAKQGVTVTVFNMYLRDFTKKNVKNYKIEAIRPYYILPERLRFALYEAYAYSLRVWRKIIHTDSFDIIHGHGEHCFFPAIFRGKIPFIMTFHGLKRAFHYKVYGPDSPNLKNPRYFTLFWPEEIAAKKCDLAIVPSKTVKDELINLYKIKPNKIKVIYNGVDTVKFKPFNKMLARKMLQLPENKKYVIWVGNNPEIKGLSMAIKAVRGLKEVYLLVVGVSGINFKNVIYWGEVRDHQLLCTLYNAAELLIFPTVYEGFPLVPLEAMACGLPIVISKECPTKEIIKDGVEGYIVNEREPRLYAEAIKTILDDGALYKKMSLNCRKLAQKYHWENQGKEYLKVYKQMAKKR